MFYNLTFTPGSTISPEGNGAIFGAAGALPGAGSVDAIGFYDNFMQSSVRIDSLSVIIPEPASLMLIAAGAGLMLTRRTSKC